MGAQMEVSIAVRNAGKHDFELEPAMPGEMRDALDEFVDLEDDEEIKIRWVGAKEVSELRGLADELDAAVSQQSPLMVSRGVWPEKDGNVGEDSESAPAPQGAAKGGITKVGVRGVLTVEAIKGVNVRQVQKIQGEDPFLMAKVTPSGTQTKRQ